MADQPDTPIQPPESGPAPDGAEYAGSEADPLDEIIGAAIDDVPLTDEGPAEGDKPDAQSLPTDQQADRGKPSTADGQGDGKAATTDENGPDPAEGGKPGTDQGERDDLLSSSPDHWPAERKAAFDKLDEAGKEIVKGIARDFEAAHTRRSVEYRKDREFAGRMRELVTPDIQEQLRRAGIDEVEGVARLIRLNNWATTDLPAYVRFLVERGQLTPGHVFPALSRGAPPQTRQPQPGQPGSTAPGVPPQFDQLTRQLSELTGRLSHLETGRQQETQQQAESFVASFANEKGESGALLRPHFAALESDIEQLLYTPQAQQHRDPRERLQWAYDTAVWMNPETRQLEAGREVATRTLSAEQQAEVDRARRAKPPVRPQGETNRPERRSQDLDDVISSAIENALPGRV